MNPRLTAMAGPLKDTVWMLTDEETYVGRDVSNRVCLGDPLVSRRHCLVKKEAGRFKISDLGSRNGTFINGMPIKESVLEHGDQIRMGDTLFVFFLDNEEAPAAEALDPLGEETLVFGAAVQMRVEDTLYLKPERILAASPPPTRIARDLNALLKIST